MPRHALTPTRRRVPRWLWMVATVVVVAALVAVPLGGWQHVDRAEAVAERLQPGQRHDAERFATTLERAEVTATRPGSSLDPEPGVAYLAVYAELENRTLRSDTPNGDLLVVEGAGDLGPPDNLVLVRDPGVPELQPGLPEEVAYVWQVDAADVVPGTELRVQVVDRTPIDSFVSAGTTWIDPRVGAVVDLVVAQGPEPEPEEDAF